MKPWAFVLGLGEDEFLLWRCFPLAHMECFKQIMAQGQLESGAGKSAMAYPFGDLGFLTGLREGAALGSCLTAFSKSKSTFRGCVSRNA